MIADIKAANAVSPMKINSIISRVVGFLFGFFAIPLSSFRVCIIPLKWYFVKGFLKNNLKNLIFFCTIKSPRTAPGAFYIMTRVSHKSNEGDQCLCIFQLPL